MPLSAGNTYHAENHCPALWSCLFFFFFCDEGTLPRPSYVTVPTRTGAFQQLLGQQEAVTCLPGLGPLLQVWSCIPSL